MYCQKWNYLQFIVNCSDLLANCKYKSSHYPVKFPFTYLSLIKVLQGTDEIILPHGPSLSASISRAIIPALQCPDILRMEAQIPTKVC